MQIEIPDELARAVMQSNLLMGQDSSITETVIDLCSFHVENTVSGPVQFYGACAGCKAEVVNQIIVADSKTASVDVICRECWESFTGRSGLSQVKRLNRLIK